MAPPQTPGNVSGAEFPRVPHRARAELSLPPSPLGPGCRRELPEGLRNGGICLSVRLGSNGKRVIKGRGRWGDYAS